MTTTTPRQAVDALLAQPRLPDGDDERFAGYGVMGLPFASGHYLALRDMAASSVGPAYRAIWHRDPEGAWTIHTTAAPDVSCPRYFSSASASSEVPEIKVTWIDDFTLEITLGYEIGWQVQLAPSPATRMMSAMGGAMPDAGWNSGSVLASMAPMARAMLRSGKVRLRGGTPNGQRFKAAPVQIWRVVGGRAHLHGQDLGELAPLAEQTRLGDFWLPQRGVFFVGRARFSSEVDPVDGSAGTRMAS